MLLEMFQESHEAGPTHTALRLALFIQGLCAAELNLRLHEGDRVNTNVWVAMCGWEACQNGALAAEMKKREGKREGWRASNEHGSDSRSYCGLLEWWVIFRDNPSALCSLNPLGEIEPGWGGGVQ